MNLIDIGVMLATPLDIIRLLAIPVFIWAAWRDHQTRRVSNKAWIPLLVIGVLFLPIEAWLAWGTSEWVFFIYPAAGGLLIVVPSVVALWSLGGFGGADAKAIITLAVLFPTYPAYYIAGSQFPLVKMTVDSVAFSVLANATVALLIVPASLVMWNVWNGNVNKVALVGKPEPVERVDQLPGKLLETPDGLDTSGLDLDALRMYLRWRGITLSDVRDHTSQIRRPGAVPADPNDPTDGAVRSDDRQRADKKVIHSDFLASTPDYGALSEPSPNDDEWGAERFLDETDKYVYGTTPEGLRDGLEVLAADETVWVSPGLPFLIPVAVGLVTTLTYGNVLFGLVQYI